MQTLSPMRCSVFVSKKPSTTCRRSMTVRVNAMKEESIDELHSNVRKILKQVRDKRSQMEKTRVQNLSKLQTTIKSILEDEIAYVQTLCESVGSMPKKCGEKLDISNLGVVEPDEVKPPEESSIVADEKPVEPNEVFIDNIAKKL